MSLTALIADQDMVPQALTRAQYDTLAEAGALEGQPVELLEGWLITVNSQGPPHSNLVDRLSSALTIRLFLAHGEAYRVRTQLPIIASDRSEPEPDIAVIDEAASDRSHHPDSAHLVVEVSFSSHIKDLIHKARIYADGGFGEYWVLDLPRQETVVHTDPRPGPHARYTAVSRVPFTEPISILGVSVRIADLDR